MVTRTRLTAKKVTWVERRLVCESAVRSHQFVIDELTSEVSDCIGVDLENL